MLSWKVILRKKFSLKTAVIKQWLNIPAAVTAEKQVFNFSLFCQFFTAVSSIIYLFIYLLPFRTHKLSLLIAKVSGSAEVLQSFVSFVHIRPGQIPWLYPYSKKFPLAQRPRLQVQHQRNLTWSRREILLATHRWPAGWWEYNSEYILGNPFSILNWWSARKTRNILLTKGHEFLHFCLRQV